MPLGVPVVEIYKSLPLSDVRTAYNRRACATGTLTRAEEILTEHESLQRTECFDEQTGIGISAIFPNTEIGHALESGLALDERFGARGSSPGSVVVPAITVSANGEYWLRIRHHKRIACLGGSVLIGDVNEVVTGRGIRRYGKCEGLA